MQQSEMALCFWIKARWSQGQKNCFYAQNQKAHLCAFLEYGEIEISNNQVENAISPFVVSRKGWLFADTPQGTEASTIIYSLMETAKADSLRLNDYLLHLLSILPEREERNKDFEIDDLLPWSEEMRSWFSAVWMLGTAAFLYQGGVLSGYVLSLHRRCPWASDDNRSSDFPKRF